MSPFLLLFAAGLFEACTPTPAITVVRVGHGDHADGVRGDALKLRRDAQDVFSGTRGGFFVVRNREDWRTAWQGSEEPAMPATLDTSKQMLILAAADRKEVRELRFQRAVETAEHIYVWVREKTLGEGCVTQSLEQAPFDAVVSTRIDKPIKFFVESEREESCGEAPKASVACRVASSQTSWSPSVNAQPGDTVECELSSTARGKFEVVDRFLSLTEQPPGSCSKLAFAKGPTRGTIMPDVYGTYGIRAEVADEAGRRGVASATIDAKPPKTKDVVVQLVWGNLDVRDEPDTFPRVTLRVAEVGGKGQRCTAEVPVPGLCEAHQHGAYTNMKIPASSRRLPLSVLYLDERIEKGPGACIHVWFDGQRTAEACDRKHRSAEERWEVGVLDTATGKLAEK